MLEQVILFDIQNLQWLDTFIWNRDSKLYVLKCYVNYVFIETLVTFAYSTDNCRIIGTKTKNRCATSLLMAGWNI